MKYSIAEIKFDYIKYEDGMNEGKPKIFNTKQAVEDGLCYELLRVIHYHFTDVYNDDITTIPDNIAKYLDQEDDADGDPYIFVKEPYYSDLKVVTKMYEDLMAKKGLFSRSEFKIVEIPERLTC